MSVILNRISELDPNNSEAVKETLSIFFKTLSKSTDSDCYRWLRTLDEVIRKFPKYCISHRHTLETYITNFLDTTSQCIVIEASKCAHSLQQVRPSHEKTATAKTCWREQVNMLCYAGHTLVGHIFNDAVDIYRNNIELQTQSPANAPLATALSMINITPSTSNNIMNKQQVLCNRLRNVFIFLQAMLVEIYPVAKPVQPQLILDVIVRVLSVSSSPGAVTKKGMSNVGVIKTQALRTLDALVTCLGANLIPYSPLVIRVVMQTLKWSSENVDGTSSKVRCVAYASLSGWLRVVRASGSGSAERWCEELAQHVCDDVTPHRHLVQLITSNRPNKNLSKKAKRKLANTMLQQSSIASHMPGEKNKIAMSSEKNDEVAIAALECAETFLITCGVFLKPEIHKQFHECVVRECYNLEKYSEERGLCLLRVLDACRKSAFGVPPPTQYCMQLYSTLLNNHSVLISKFCSEALLDIRLHLHCSPPSLNFALAPELSQYNIDEEKQRQSKRNRLALEELLGPDRMPSEEPTVKKTCLEQDIEDKISISSDSNSSVKICENEEIKTNSEIIKERNPRELLADGVENADSNDKPKPTVTTTTTVIRQNNEKEKVNIYDAATQLPIDVSNDTIDGEISQLSMEVAYDYPNIGIEKQSLIDKIDDENIPSSNETDDLHITCGQKVQISQDAERGGESIKTNGIDATPCKKIVENGVSDNIVTVVNDKAITVNDMLADFVDEVD